MDHLINITKNHIIEIGNSINIIAMGEATHGQEKITELRFEIFKSLVEYCNFSVFILEEQYSTCQLINDWILSNSLYDINYLMNKLMWPWRSIQMSNFIRWMKTYNENNDNKLSFMGIDVQFIDSDYKIKNDVTIYIDNIINELDNLPNNETDEMCGFELRDEAMFNVFMKIYDPTKKYFLYFHNGHVSKKYFFGNYKNLGYLLSKKFLDKYYVIGNSFNGYSYLGLDMNYHTLNIVTFKNGIDLSKVNIYDSENDIFHPSEIKNKFKFSDGLTLKNFEGKYIINSGAAIDINNPYRFLTMHINDNMYDAIIQIPDESALNLIFNFCKLCRENILMIKDNKKITLVKNNIYDFSYIIKESSSIDNKDEYDAYHLLYNLGSSFIIRCLPKLYSFTHIDNKYNLIMEYIKGIDGFENINDKNFWICLMFQLSYFIYILEKNMIQHNDFYLGNIIIEQKTYQLKVIDLETVVDYKNKKVFSHMVKYSSNDEKYRMGWNDKFHPGSDLNQIFGELLDKYKNNIPKIFYDEIKPRIIYHNKEFPYAIMTKNKLTTGKKMLKLLCNITNKYK